MKSIRKLSIGKDYPNGTLHYQVGSRQRLKRQEFEIVEILEDRNTFPDKVCYNIYLKNVPVNGEPVATFKWKTVVDVPVVIEENIPIR